MSKYYNEKYDSDEFFWGKQPSSTARIFLQKFPPHEGQTLIDIGCGEGRDSIFFARNGYRVTSFDFSAEGIKKSIAWAEELNLSIDFFQADINKYRLENSYDVVFTSGALHYIPQNSRKEIISNYKQFTRPGGVHAFMVPIDKPFVPKNPQDDPLEQDWLSGKILTHYHDWKIEFFSEEIQDDGDSGYKWAFNRMIAREPSRLVYSKGQ
ncbi:MAG: methyltransferase domain-containing protein [Lysobacterales bacterium]|jgi:tellurite methyltransferase